MKNYLIPILFFVPIFCFALELTAPPAWIEAREVPLPEGKAALSENGEYYHFLDKQIKISDESIENFSALYIELTNIRGVENNSQISIYFSSAYEKVQMHSLYVLRDKEIIDKSASALHSILDVEGEAMNLMYSGRKNYHVILNDVRPDDILVYSYSLIGKNPIFQDHYSFTSPLNYNAAVKKKELRIFNYSHRELRHQELNFTGAPAVRRFEDHTKYLWTSEGLEQIFSEDNTPSWYTPNAHINISSFQSWDELKEWAAQLFAVELSDEDGKILDDTMAEILGAEEDKKAQIGKIIQWVQMEIRYLGLEMGINSHKPTHPVETIEKRYGDCKDKVLLLNRMLARLGVESRPALVSTFDRGTISDNIPMISSFDHVISWIRYDGKTYWIDPTKNFQAGSLENLAQANYGKALLLNPERDRPLADMAVPDEEVTKRIEYNYDLTKSPNELQVIGVYKGAEADYMRELFSVNSKKDMQKDYLNYYAKFHNEIELLEDIAIEDDRERNTIRTTESYTVENLLEEDGEGNPSVNLYPRELASYLPIDSLKPRTMPYSLGYPLHINQVLSVKFQPGQTPFSDSDFAVDSPYHRFQLTSRYRGIENRLVNSFSYRTLQDSVAVEDYVAFQKELAAVSDKMDYSYFSVNDAEEGAGTKGIPFLLSPLIGLTAFLIYTFHKRRTRKNT